MTTSARCRSCSAPIIWTVTDAGKRMPVDAEPAPGGNLRLRETIGGVVRSRVVGAAIDLFDDTDDGTRHYPHHATCPDGPEWKTKR